MPGGNWITKLLKTGARIVVRATAFEAVRYCIKCAAQKTHGKHEDEDGSSHYFCKSCGAHN